MTEKKTDIRLLEQFNYPHTILPNGDVSRSVYIHFAHPLDNKNYLIGKVTNILSPPDYYYTIECFEDSLNYILDKFGYIYRISGCPYDKRLKFEYKNKLPYFVYERTLDPSRPDLQRHLDRVGMVLYDRFEFMRRTHGVVTYNRYFVHDDKDTTNFHNEWLHDLSLKYQKG